MSSCQPLTADRGCLTHRQVLALASEVDYGAEVIRFLAYTGLRSGEMAALRVLGFDMLRRRVNVSRAVGARTRAPWCGPPLRRPNAARCRSPR